MVAKRMGSQRGGNDSNGENQIQPEDSKSNSLARQGSLYSLTIDEVQNQLGDLGKPLSSMNLDELLKTVWTAEANNQALGDIDYGPTTHQPGPPASGSSLNRQSSVTLTRDLSKKTVDEVWQDIQQGQNQSSLDRNATLGTMTLEDFLVKAGVVPLSSQSMKNSDSVLEGVDSMVLPQQAQWMNFQIPSINPQQQQQQQQQQSMLPVFMPGPPVQQSIPIGGNPVMDAAYSESQITMSPSPLMGTLSDTQTPGRKRLAPGDIVEKTVERRQKRMIKNRESAARSRARKQAYTHELENKVSRLEEENERLKRRKVAIIISILYIFIYIKLFPYSALLLLTWFKNVSIPIYVRKEIFTMFVALSCCSGMKVKPFLKEVNSKKLDFDGIFMGVCA